MKNEDITDRVGNVWLAMGHQRLIIKSSWVVLYVSGTWIPY